MKIIWLFLLILVFVIGCVQKEHSVDSEIVKKAICFSSEQEIINFLEKTESINKTIITFFQPSNLRQIATLEPHDNLHRWMRENVDNISKLKKFSGEQEKITGSDHQIPKIVAYLEQFQENTLISIIITTNLLPDNCKEYLKYPSDGFLELKPEEHQFGGRASKNLKNYRISIHDTSDYPDIRQRNRIWRFWTLYLERRGSAPISIVESIGKDFWDKAMSVSSNPLLIEEPLKSGQKAEYLSLMDETTVNKDQHPSNLFLKWHESDTDYDLLVYNKVTNEYIYWYKPVSESFGQLHKSDLEKGRNGWERFVSSSNIDANELEIYVSLASGKPVPFKIYIIDLNGRPIELDVQFSPEPTPSWFPVEIKDLPTMKINDYQRVQTNSLTYSDKENIISK